MLGTSLKYSMLEKVRYRDMRELSKDEMEFLAEIYSPANQEKEFLAWVDSFEAWLESSMNCCS